jgi:hypothetical protein
VRLVAERRAVELSHLDLKFDVLQHGAPRQEHRALEHDTDLGTRSIDGLTVDQHLAAARRD